jgi:O-antigen/teichoic acid export membrane protein
MANLFDLICGANGQILVSSDYYRFNLIFALLLVVIAIVTNIIFIPLFGITGAALATTSSILLYNLMKLVFVWIKFSIQPFSWQTTAMIMNGSFVLLISFLLPAFENIYVDILIRSVLITILYVAIIWIFNLSLEFKEATRDIINKLF